MKYIDIYDLRDEIELLSTGMTEKLSSMQDEFYKLFQQVEQIEDDWNDVDAFEHVWEYTPDIWEDEDRKQKFLGKIKDIITIPSYKYVFQYLLLKFSLYISKDNLEEFWTYLESEKWDMKEGLESDEIKSFKVQLMYKQTQKDQVQSSLLLTDCHMILSILVHELKQEYSCCGLDLDKNGILYIKKILYHFDLKLLNEIALVLRMDYSYYRIFRKKVLKLSEVNFYDRENIFVYLVLNYADACNISNYVQAYHTLKALYPEPVEENDKPEEIKTENKDTKAKRTKKIKKNTPQGAKKTTKEIGQMLHEQLEDASGQLKNALRQSLFLISNPDIAFLMKKVDAVNRKMDKRSVERIFLEQWKLLEEHIFRYEREVILEKVRLDKKNEVSEVSYVGKQKIYRWLYGMNVYRREKNRNVDRKDKEMISLGGEGTDYLLNSRTFLETRIRDNTFSAFPLDEERQRNLLMTVGFLNFVLESERGTYLAETYSDRLVDFEIYMYKLFAPCGFMLPHSGNAYDAFLKLLLSCDAPVELFKDIWRQKTDSPE